MNAYHVIRKLPLILGGLFLSLSVSPSFAQVTTDLTPSGLNTQVSAPTVLPGGQANYDITGGTRPGNGANLFHSFGDFSVAPNAIANFLNDTNQPTTNIVGRVTGGDPSNIFGTVQTTGFGNANLFLINPAGVVFGSTASINVGGAIYTSTADYVKLADGVRFNAIPGAGDALLSTAPVAAFGFLGPNSPNAIMVKGSVLEVANGQTLALIGGDGTFPDPENPSALVPPGVTLDGAKLSAPGGQITLVRVGQVAQAGIPGEVTLPGQGASAHVTQSGLTNVSSLVLSGGTHETVIDMSGTGSSTVRIRGGQLVMNDWPIVRGPAAGGIDVALDGRADIVGTVPNPGSFFQSSGLFTLGSLVDAGPITLTTPILNLTGNAGITSRMDVGGARTGNVTLNVHKLNVRDGAVIGTNHALVGLSRGAVVTIQGLQEPGSMTDAINISSGLLRAGGREGAMNIFARSVAMDGTARIDGRAAEANPGASISLNVETLSLKDSSQIIAGGTRSLNPGQPITITASDSVRISGQEAGIIGTAHGIPAGSEITITTPSVIVTNGGRIESKSVNFDLGGPTFTAGNITLNVGTLKVDGGAQINTSVESDGFRINNAPAGHITIQGIGGQNTQATSVDITGNSSGLFSETGPVTAGPAGHISVNARQFTLADGATISVATSGVGAGAVGGSAIINAKGIVLGEETSIKAGSKGDGNAGSVLLNAENNIVLNKSVVSAQSEGTGTAGTVQLKAGVGLGGTGFSSLGSVAIENGAQVDVNGHSAGAIMIRGGQFLLDHSSLSAQPLGSFEVPGQGGLIRVDADTIQLRNEAGLFAGRGPGGGHSGTISLQATGAVTLDQSTLDTGNSFVSPFNPGTIAVTGAEVTIANGSSIVNWNAGSSPVPGSISLTAEGGAVVLDNSSILSDTFYNGGGPINVNIKAGDIAINNGTIINGVTELDSFTAIPGNVTLTAERSVSIVGTPPPPDCIFCFGSGVVANTIFSSNSNLASVTVEAPSITLNGGVLLTQARGGVTAGDGGTISLLGNQISLTGGALISANVFHFGDSKGGPISIRAKSLSLTGGSTISSNAYLEDSRGGTINIQVKNLNISGGSQLTTDGLGLLAGRDNTTGGNIVVNAANNLDVNQGVVSADGVGAGNGGIILLRVGNGAHFDQSVVSADSKGGGTGNAGTAAIGAGNNISVNSSTISAQSDGSGQAGTVLLGAGNSVQVDNSTVSARNTGTGDAGNIFIGAGNNIRLNQGTVSVQSTQGNGGNILFGAGNSIRLDNSNVSAQSDPPGNDGSIFFAARNRILLRNSTVTPAPVIILGEDAE